MVFPWIVLCTILLIVIIVLLIKIILMRKSMNEICESMGDHLFSDTNKLISVSSNDKYVRRIAKKLNKHLAELRKSQRQYQIGNRELKDAVTNISHDLRTPLTAICGYLDLLNEEHKSEEVTRYLAHIAERAEALKTLTEELFQYSVIISTKEELQYESICVNAVLENSVASFYHALTERNITPNITITEKHVMRRLNQAALSRVFGNILDNAVKYSDGDLDISLSDDGKIIFSNTAISLDEVQVGKLFDRFYTVEAARRSTGLGLAIAKTLVEQMNGKIEANYKNKKISIVVSFSEVLQ